jgi:Zn-dependent protease with chaperone function
MTYAVYVPIAVSALLALAARPLTRRLPTRWGGHVLAAAAVAAAISTLWTLALLAVTLVDDIPGTRYREALPIQDVTSTAAVALLALALARTVTVHIGQRRLRAALRPVLAGSRAELVVVAHPQPQAFATPGRHGRIVVTDSMFRALTPAQRRVLLAHERAHLAARHPLLLAAARYAAAADPLLIPLRGCVTYLCERHADEAAAREVGDRMLVAAALAAVADAMRAARSPGLPAFGRWSVADRVAALAGPATHTGRLRTLWTVGMLGAVTTGAAVRATVALLDLLAGIAQAA